MSVAGRGLPARVGGTGATTGLVTARAAGSDATGQTGGTGATTRSVASRDGTSLSVRVREPAGAGTATPVLAVHDLDAAAEAWDGVAAGLAAGGRPVAAVDLRGHGHSGRPESGYDLVGLADDLVAVLDGLGWDRPAVVAGDGWGGAVALELAARAPTRLAALALVDGGTLELSGRYADWPTCLATMAPEPVEGRSAAWLERMLRLRHPDWPETGIAGALASFDVLGDGTLRPWVPARIRVRILEQLWDHHPAELYPAIRTPVLLIPAGDPTGAVPRHETARRSELARAQGGLATVATTWVDGDHDLVLGHPGELAACLEALAAGEIFPGR